MTSSVALCEALPSATDDRARTRVTADAFERLDERYPLPPDLATQTHLRAPGVVNSDDPRPLAAAQANLDAALCLQDLPSLGLQGRTQE
jgi:hypothetical protein